jgi:putative SOS response-associated peptidase YedK
MCNDYEQHVRWAEYRKLMQALDLMIPSHQSELDLPQADDIRINDTGPVMRAAAMPSLNSPARSTRRQSTAQHVDGLVPAHVRHLEQRSPARRRRS